MTKIAVQPNSLEAEDALLGCILRDETCFDRSKKYLTKSTMFYSGIHRKVYNIMRHLDKNDKGIDTVSVVSMITKTDKDIYPALDGYFITGLLDHGMNSKVEIYSRIIAEKYYQRELIKDADDIQKFCFDNTNEYNDIVKKVNVITSNLQSMSTGKEFDLKKLAKETNKAINEPVDLIEYGYSSLNSLAGGMTRGEVSVIAGRPGHGKTTFIINLTHQLLKQGYKVLVINREMSNKEMMKKLLVLSSGNLSHSMIRSGNIDSQTQREINRSLDHLVNHYNNSLIMFDDVFTLNQSSNVIEKFRPDVVIDDHIQLIKVNSKLDGRRFEIEEIMQEYKMLSKKHNMVSILVSQLNRNIEQRVDPVPKLSDLAESGSIEQIAENIIFVYYDYKVRYEKSDYGPNRNQIIAAKVRYGVSGTLTMGFNGDKCLFHENIAVYKPNEKADIHIPKNATIAQTKDVFKAIADQV